MLEKKHVNNIFDNMYSMVRDVYWQTFSGSDGDLIMNDPFVFGDGNEYGTDPDELELHYGDAIEGTIEFVPL